MIDIIVPTNKPKNKLKKFFEKLEDSINDNYRIVYTGFPVSAAVNRNYGLNQSTSDIIIMIDDDTDGFYSGWADKLIKPLCSDNVIMVSARLMENKKKTGVMMSILPDLSVKYQSETINYFERTKIEPIKVLPSACIAFRKNNIRYDEKYIGAGYEDTDYCMQLNCKYPNGKYIINNEVKMIHKNKMTNQMFGQLESNKRYYHNKWGLPL